MDISPEKFNYTRISHIYSQLIFKKITILISINIIFSATIKDIRSFILLSPRYIIY